jgi:hypothetical protein
MPDPRLDIVQRKVRDLVEDYRSGRVVIPEFQREYVWKPGRAPALIDSLYRQFPISTLLLWTSEEPALPRRNDPKPTRSGAIDWLIDGQQRVITLNRTMSGDEGIDVVFNPDTQEFKLANAATKRDLRWYRVSDILDEEHYRQIRRGLPETRQGQLREGHFERVRKILDYEVPIVRMADHSFDSAVLAFARINTLGVKLKKGDIESARVAAKHSGFIREEVSPFLTKIRNDGFTRINVMHLFRACAFVAQPDGRSRTPLHELERPEVNAAWARTKRATEEAIGLLRSQFGVVNMDVLWSGALLVPVIAICATRSPQDRDLKGLAGWLAAAALFHRYSVATETALDQDLRACRADDPVGALLGNLRRDKGDVKATADDFTGPLMDKGALFGLYVACRHQGLQDLFTGASILMQRHVDRHHLLPRAQFPERLRASADTLANIAFVSGSTNRSVNSSGPEVYLRKIDPQILESQCIPLDESLWRIDRAEEFWDARRELLADAFNAFIKEALPRRRVDAA